MSLLLWATMVCLRTCRCDYCPCAVLTPLYLSLCLLCDIRKALPLSEPQFCSLSKGVAVSMK